MASDKMSNLLDIHYRFLWQTDFKTPNKSVVITFHLPTKLDVRWKLGSLPLLEKVRIEKCPEVTIHENEYLYTRWRNCTLT